MIRSISHVLAAIFSNASDFNRHWSQDDSQTSTDESVPHRWEGQWISDVNGHHGALRCLLRQNGPTEYAARFYAVYGGVLRVSYSVPLHGTKSEKRLVLEGDADLGRLAGGVYHYAGEATDGAFRCTYKSQYDHGTFEMHPVTRAK